MVDGKESNGRIWFLELRMLRRALASPARSVPSCTDSFCGGDSTVAWKLRIGLVRWWFDWSVGFIFYLISFRTNIRCHMISLKNGASKWRPSLFQSNLLAIKSQKIIKNIIGIFELAQSFSAILDEYSSWYEFLKIGAVWSWCRPIRLFCKLIPAEFTFNKISKNHQKYNRYLWISTIIFSHFGWIFIVIRFFEVR